MLVESMATSLVVGKARGGKIRNFEKVNFRGWYLFIIGFIIEFSSVIIRVKDLFGIGEILNNNFIFVHSASYTLIIIGLILNFKKHSMKIILVGTLLNFIVILVNGGKMPVSGDGLALLGLFENLKMLETDSMITHTLVKDTTKLYFLGDIIPLKKPYPLPKMISIGDVFLGVGIFTFIQGVMLKKFSKSTKMISFEYKKE
ncbi:MAG: hypothetical protein FH751_02725 [Firmicutes bacterium]|nr:hypothetical protein [Bacillota bacterium]